MEEAKDGRVSALFRLCSGDRAVFQKDLEQHQPPQLSTYPLLRMDIFINVTQGWRLQTKMILVLYLFQVLSFVLC